MPDMHEPVSGEIVKFDQDERTAFGWAYVSHDVNGEPIVDRQGDFVDDPEVLAKAAYDFVLDFAQGDVYHNEQKVADLIESVVFTPEKVAKMGLPPMPCGWWIGMKVTDDATWADIKNAKLPAFSIGGMGIREAVEG